MRNAGFKINEIKFTLREFEIIACVISGHSWKVIAKLLGISPETVHHHVKRIKLKVKCNSVDQLISFAEASPQYEKLHEMYVMQINSQKTR